MGGNTKTILKRYVLRFLRLALVVAPLVWIYSRADAAALWGVFGAVDVPLLFFVAALTFAGILLQGVKWWILIRRFVPDLRLVRAVSVHLESTFYAIALPSAAQDVVKSVMLSKSHSPSVVWAASWLGRLVGLFSILVYSAIGALYLKDGLLPDGFRVSLLTAVAVMLVLGAASFSKRFTRPFRAAAAKFLSPKIMAKADALREGIYAFKYAKATLAQTVFISFAIQLLIFFTISMTVYAASGGFYFMECLTFAALVEIVVVSLPLTPGGVGVREALMALLFTRLGFTGEQIALYATISLLMSMVRVFGGIIPLYRVIKGRKPSIASKQA